MDNENKETEFDPSDIELDLSDLDSGNKNVKTIEEEFDPTNSDAFYSNLEAALGTEKEPAGKTAGAVDGQAPQEPGSEEDDIFLGVDAALAEQIEQEFGSTEEVSVTEEKKSNKLLAALKRIPTWTKVLVSVILVILLSVGLLFGTKGGRSLVYKAISHIIMKTVPVDPDEGFTPTPELTVTVLPTDVPEPTTDPLATPEPTGAGELTPEPTTDPLAVPTETPTPTPVIELMDDEDVINVLLLGEENMVGAIRGRTDAIILVSVNLNGGNLKMVSFMRDMYVNIPGKGDDRLNAAYAYGGASLIVETIEKNFGVDIDAYVKVNFSGFESIIDELGGLEISLTARESEYLNTTKYISKPEERNTVAGKQRMTGSQVLGYCRVRYVPTANGLENDRGRNYRHRVVLQALFDQNKDKSLVELWTIMNNFLKNNYVTRSENLDKIAPDCLQTVIEEKMFTIDSLQLPMSGTYKDLVITDPDTGENKWVISYFPSNVDGLQDFLYGEE
ncbi:MAG: LCP family protein [Lachnospiraceae bacterium]|nr:LCP family protein [Lachnospiraceae bacterium]